MEPSPSRRRRPSVVTVLAVAVSVALAGVLGILVARRHHQGSQMVGARLASMPAGVSNDTANLMGLGQVAPRLAPAFTLTDQTGATLPLSSFRGKVVVLEAMDPHCTDICPLVSKEFVNAYHDLGPLAAKVVFAAINVNQYFAGVADVRAFSTAHDLTSIPDWHFFTGPTQQLRAAWAAYDIQVQSPNHNADIVHTSVVYFIDPHGVERYMASPMADRAPNGSSYLPPSVISAWGKGIAATARQLIS